MRLASIPDLLLILRGNNFEKITSIFNPKLWVADGRKMSPKIVTGKVLNVCDTLNPAPWLWQAQQSVSLSVSVYSGGWEVFLQRMESLQALDTARSDSATGKPQLGLQFSGSPSFQAIETIVSQIKSKMRGSNCRSCVRVVTL